MFKGNEVRRVKSLPRSRPGKIHGGSDRDLSRFVGSLSEPIAVFDGSERIVLMNGPAENLFGYRQVELRDQKMELLMPERLRGKNGHAAHRLVEDGMRSGTTELLAVRKDGSMFAAHVRVSLWNAASRPRYIAVIRQAGLEVPQAEPAGLRDLAREGEHRLKELINGLPVAVYTTDADGYLTLYNEAAEAFWGRRPVLGKDRWCGSWKLYFPDGAPMPLRLCPLAITLREQRPVGELEVTVERPDGTRLTFIPHPTPLRDASGKLIGAMNVLVDITERKRAEKALQQQAGLIDLSFDAIFVWRQPGGIEFWNKGAALLYGFEKKEALGKTSHKLLQSRCSDPWDRIEARLRERGFWEGEVRHVTKEGREVFVSSRHQLVADKDGAMLILETNRDITGRRRAEAELGAARQQLESELANMTRLHEVSMRFVQQGDLHGLLDQILDAAIDVTGAEKGNIQLLDNDGRTLQIATQRGFSRDFLDSFSQVHEGECSCGTALRRMERVIVEDIATSPIFVGTPALEVILSEGCRSVQSTPLFTRAGRLLGMFSTYYGVPWRFTESDLRLLDLLARQAADFIERFQSDEKLRESREQLAAILDSAMDAVISVDADRWIVLFNRAAEKVFGCSASEAVGSPLERFIPARFHGGHGDQLGLLAKAGEITRKVGRLGAISGLRADGEEFPIEASISQVCSAGKQFYTIIARDITRRVREEETLRRQAELLNLSHDAIFVWDAAKGIEFWSEGATQLYGYELREVHGLPPHVLFKTGFPRPWPQIEAELREHGSWEGELHRKTKSDREVIVSCRLQLVSDTAAATLILETDRDITERRRLEQELLEISSAEQRRIGQDLHDGLCQHLAGIEFRTSVLVDQFANTPKVQREIAKIGELIREGARQARMLSHGLSPVSLKADGLMTALKELTEDVAELFTKTCRFDCPKPVLVKDKVVATHLYRIAQEAVSNAARHGQADTIVVALRRTARATTLSITDNGRGFPTPAGRAGGMGLRIMRYRAEMIGALLTVGAAKGKGTSVVCVLK